MKKLIDILQGIEYQKVIGNLDIKVSGIEADSRKVATNFVFIASSGTQVDGHLFINQAIGNGATTIICEKLPEILLPEITYIQVADSLKLSGLLATAFYDFPSHKLILIAVIGTNGKTSTATLLYSLFRSLGYKVGLLSTVRNYINDEIVAATHTTPDPIQLNLLLSKMVEKGCSYCFMEVSSHAIVQKRIEGLHFTGGIFTNITHDHLDYHKTFAEYLKAKKLFFDNLTNQSFALINIDDKNGNVMVQNTNAKVKTYSLKSDSDFKCRIIESHFDGTLLNIDGTELWTKFIGQFNAYNILAVYSAALLLNQKKEEILLTISKLSSVEGRFETFTNDNKITAIVDYAHTPDALENILTTINKIRTGNEQLITIVGAGGNRDKTKRPEMARIVAELSDKVILTSDNPRDEEPEQIIEDMLKGVSPEKLKNVISIIHRREAIKTACMLAHSSDILVIAGKGHETYMEIKGVKHHFDDREEVKKFLNIK